MKKIIYSEPTGGLCNRMGALNYAYLFAKKYDCKLVVLWKDNFEAACKFEDVFEKIDGDIEIRNITYFKKTPRELLNSGRIVSFLIRGIWHSILDMYFKYFLKREIELIYEDATHTRKEAHELNEMTMKEWFESDSKWCTLSSYQCADLEHDYSILKFHRDFETAVDKLYKAYFKDALFEKENVVGVHVRRGDHDYAIKNNPLENFKAKMELELQSNPKTVFYLASDGADVIEYMNKEFPGKIIYNKGAALTRKSKSGMENAIIDLLALSKTRSIIGSFGSTFSDMASYIGKNKLVYSNDK